MKMEVRNYIKQYDIYQMAKVENTRPSKAFVTIFYSCKGIVFNFHGFNRSFTL